MGRKSRLVAVLAVGSDIVGAAIASQEQDILQRRSPPKSIYFPISGIPCYGRKSRLSAVLAVESDIGGAAIAPSNPPIPPTKKATPNEIALLM
jgi:hypothetical protein